MLAVVVAVCVALLIWLSVSDRASADGGSLAYDPVADQYVYVWKTVKTWAGKCGTFTLKLDDGTEHSALFSFTK